MAKLRGEYYLGNLFTPILISILKLGLSLSLAFNSQAEDTPKPNDCLKSLDDLGKTLHFEFSEPLYSDVRKQLQNLLDDAGRSEIKIDGVMGVERSLYLSNLFKGRISLEEIAAAVMHPALKGKELPLMKKNQQQEDLIKALSGENSPNTRAFAFYNADKFKRSHPELHKFLKAFANSSSEEMKIKTSQNGLALMWYPRYPEGHTSCTHIKIIVDGEVWGTMNTYEKFKEQKVHETLARRSLKDSFFKFNLKASPEEIERMNYLLKNNDRRGTGAGTCIAGACGALRESGIQDIPFPFNQLPSLAALYLGIKSRFPNSQVFSIEFHGKSLAKSLFSADILVDGMVVGAVTGVSSLPIWYPILLKDHQERERKKREERELFWKKIDEKMKLELKKNPKLIEKTKSKDWNYEKYQH
jgi:hypothetical protein